jgi:hypothetical protein
MADKKLFDLHFEIGMTDKGQYYAKTVLGANKVMYRREDTFVPSCVGMTCVEMEAAGMLGLLAMNPQLSSYPFGTAPSVNTQSVNKKSIDPNASKQKPSDLTQVSHPECTALCTSFEFFGKDKCKNMCAQRKGI